MKIFLRDIWKYLWPWLVSIPILPAIFFAMSIFIFGAALVIDWITKLTAKVPPVCGWLLVVFLAMIVVRVSGFPEWVIKFFKK